MTFSRRQFLLNLARSAKPVLHSLLQVLLVILYQQQSYVHQVALAEDEFNTACIRCGLCVNDYPYPTLSLAILKDNVALARLFYY